MSTQIGRRCSLSIHKCWYLCPTLSVSYILFTLLDTMNELFKQSLSWVYNFLTTLRVNSEEESWLSFLRSLDAHHSWKRYISRTPNIAFLMIWAQMADLDFGLIHQNISIMKALFHYQGHPLLKVARCYQIHTLLQKGFLRSSSLNWGSNSLDEKP